MGYTWRVFNQPALHLFFSTDGSHATIDHIEVQISNVPTSSLSNLSSKPVLISASLFQFPTPPQLALLFFICSFMSPDWQLKALLPCFWTVFLWVECRFWYPLLYPLVLRSLPQLYIIPISNLQLTFSAVLLPKIILFTSNFFPALCPPPSNPWCKLSIGVLHCVSRLQLKKEKQNKTKQKAPMVPP